MSTDVSEELLLRVPPAFTLVFCAAYSSALKMEAICSSETSVDIQRTTQRYIPEDSTLQCNYLLNAFKFSVTGTSKLCIQFLFGPQRMALQVVCFNCILYLLIRCNHSCFCQICLKYRLAPSVFHATLSSIELVAAWSGL
jgi:hypothetical protein